MGDLVLDSYYYLCAVNPTQHTHTHTKHSYLSDWVFILNQKGFLDETEQKGCRWWDNAFLCL